jgi:hypothetical protein
MAPSIEPVTGVLWLYFVELGISELKAFKPLTFEYIRLFYSHNLALMPMQ